MLAAMGEERVPYDEFGLFHENAAEYGLPFDAPPTVRRVDVEVEPGRSVSALVWGDAPPEVVFLHGGAQNAHTWDTVAMALGVPLVAIDLPGHGHSDWRDDGLYTPPKPGRRRGCRHRRARPGCPAARRHVARRHDGDVRGVPSPTARAQPGDGRRDARCERAEGQGRHRLRERSAVLLPFRRPARPHDRAQPTRTESSLRRGILHNAHQLDDGSWEWRYDRRGHARTRPADDETAPTETPAAESDPRLALSPLWEDVSNVQCPLLLVRGRCLAGGGRRRRGRTDASPARRRGGRRRRRRPQRPGRQAPRTRRPPRHPPLTPHPISSFEVYPALGAG